MIRNPWELYNPLKTNLHVARLQDSRVPVSIQNPILYPIKKLKVVRFQHVYKINIYFKYT